MSVYSTPIKKHATFYPLDPHLTPKTPGSKLRPKEREPGEGGDPASRSIRPTDLTKGMNRTYVISDLSKGGGAQGRAGTPGGRGTPGRVGTPGRGRLTLQRRKTSLKTGVENSESTMGDSSTQDHTPAPEKRLTLQRRARTGSIDRSTQNTDISKAAERHRGVGGTERPKVLSESNPKTTAVGVFRSVSLRDTARSRGTDRPPYAQKHAATSSGPHGDAARAETQQGKTYSTPTKNTPFEKITAKKDLFERLAGRQVPKATALKSASLERPKTHAYAEPKQAAIPRSNQFSAHHTYTLPPTQVKKTAAPTSSLLNGNAVSVKSTGPAAPPVVTPPAPPPAAVPEPPVPVRSSGALLRQRDSLKTENSAVTVAVRVRPFSAREKLDQATQVIFMSDQETVVQHPDTKQSFSFSYDFSFCSVDPALPGFSGQQTVYEKLARPLLERAFEGFNTCLFAYGQTGSGKSYTMMGFGEEAGVIPRFCEELFSRLSSTENKEVTYHLEMSYFEVYNEKIHDLLVVKEEQNQNQRRLPLRVREHPVHGPYVAELSTFVVSDYADIQGWLELGNKQRATAATGMNDKSSRSHSVFMLVMTQTKTELVEGEQHDHRITSRINLVDLAGSERCSKAQTSGDRLREGASINRSLLTLGKVISALSEQSQTSRTIHTPYRESVLTWLLKESLGGNSQTAMMATLSPAGCHAEESLSTLRYAQQARMILNAAKVNEDANARLVRELKAEVEKLRAAQMSSQGVEPERMRLFKQEIAALKGQLSQQERAMAEAHRAWRERLEQAEVRKREENKELQRAPPLFKVDNRLPNLVNLNEDPQLSEMLLYLIREGRTEVGQRRAQTPHDIQLSGALIAHRHCVISHDGGTVSVAPLENAKTFVNGSLISDTTVLHHGDRVILGGDHYFRFNHPAEVQSGKRVSCWTGAGDGQKDFEFAKNELLSAQRAQLEAEIEDARLRAKEEMLQGIQVAKDLAQKELQDQRSQYEDRITALERELEESERKRVQEEDQKKTSLGLAEDQQKTSAEDQQRLTSQMERLQSANAQLEQEVDGQRRRLRLHMEAQVTRQAMEEHNIRQARIVEALEEEKRKIGRDLEERQRRLALRGTPDARGTPNPRNEVPQWDAMKLSLMIEEANKISAKLRKKTVFSRHEAQEKEGGGAGPAQGALQVQVQNTKLGISTFWSLEKFQSSLAAMRDLEQGDSASRDEDVFYDPNDEWEPDISASPAGSAFSRRRSRSLLKSRRISGRLYEIRVHPIQSLLNSPTQSSDSALPGICKDLIGQTVALLRRCHGAEESVADRLTSDLCCVHAAVKTIAGLYDRLDEDSQENVFVCSLEAQAQLVRATSAVERAVLVTLQWLGAVRPGGARPGSNPVCSVSEELRTQVKRMGGFFQLLIQGCDSEISSMVTEAERKSARCLEACLREVGHLAALTGTPLLAAEPGANQAVLRALVEGSGQGVASLLKLGLTAAQEMLRRAQLAYPRTPVLLDLKSKMLDLARALQSYIHCNMTEREDSLEKAGLEDADPSDLLSLRNTAAQLFQLHQAVRELSSALCSALTGNRGDSRTLGAHSAAILSSSKTLVHVVSGLPKELASSSSSSSSSSTTASCGAWMPCVRSVVAARDELHAALQSLCDAFAHQQGAEASAKEEEEGGSVQQGGSSGAGFRNRTVPKMVYSLSSGVSSSNSSESRDPRWV